MARPDTEEAKLASVIQVMEITDALKGHRVCCTGHLGLGRTDVHKIIEVAGGRVHDTLKRDTTLLVSNADWTRGSLQGAKVSSKYAKAKEWGIRILTEKAFLQMIIDRGKQACGEF